MTATQLKELEKRLWEAADQLRANSRLTAAQYSFPARAEAAPRVAHPFGYANYYTVKLIKISRA